MRFEVIVDSEKYIVLCDKERILRHLSYEKKNFLEGFYMKLMGDEITYYSEQEYLDNIAKIEDTLLFLLEKDTIKELILKNRDKKRKRFNKRKLLFNENSSNAFCLYRDQKRWVYSALKVVPKEESIFEIVYVDVIEITH